MRTEDAIITTSYGDGILVEEHKESGVFGLIATKRKSGDVNYKQFCYPTKYSQKERGPVPDTSQKVRPISVRLGKDPVKVLRELLAYFEKKGL